MPIYDDPEREAERAAQEREEREREERLLDKKNEHTEKLTKLTEVSGQRRRVVERVLLGTLKAPTLPLAVVVLLVIVLTGNDVPVALEAFLTL